MNLVAVVSKCLEISAYSLYSEVNQENPMNKQDMHLAKLNKMLYQIQIILLTMQNVCLQPNNFHMHCHNNMGF